MKSPLTYLLLAVIIFLVFLRSCPGEHKGATPAEIQKQVTKLEAVKAKQSQQDSGLTKKGRDLDTAGNNLAKKVKRYDHAKIEAKKLPCDSAVNVITTACDSLEETALYYRSVAQAYKDSTESYRATSRKERALADTIINLQAHNLALYQDSLKQKQRRSFWRGFKWGFGAGAVSGVVVGMAVR